MSKEESEKLIDIFSRKNMYGDLICETEIVLANKDVFGDNKVRKMNFQVWDGMALCTDFEGKAYQMTYPKKSLINVASEMADTIRKHLDLEDGDKIDPIHILMTYNQLSEF